MSSLLELEHKQKIFSNAFRIFLFPSYSFGIETINTFMRFRSSLKTIPDSRTKQAQGIPVFRPKRPKNTPLGVAHTYNGLYKVVPTPHHHPRHPTIIWTDLIVTDCENTTVSGGSTAKKKKKKNRWEKLIQFMLERRANCAWKWYPRVLESHQSLHWLW